MYSSDAQENDLPRSVRTVHERIHQLESLVFSLMRRDTMVQTSTGSALISDPPSGSSRTDHPRVEGSRSHSPLATITSAVFAIDGEENVNTSSVPLDGGYMKYNKYVGSSHWAAVLDSISELKGNVEQGEEICNMATDLNEPNFVHTSSPWLLYGCQRATKAEILSSIPPRRAADRLVSRYLALDFASGKSITLKFKLYKAVTDNVIANGADRDFSSWPLSY